MRQHGVCTAGEERAELPPARDERRAGEAVHAAMPVYPPSASPSPRDRAWRDAEIEELLIAEHPALKVGQRRGGDINGAGEHAAVLRAQFMSNSGINVAGKSGRRS